MRVSVIDAKGNIATIEMDEESPIEDLKALVEVEMNIPFAQQTLLFDNKKLEDKSTLKSCGLKDGDMVQVQNNQLGNLLSMIQNIGRAQGQGQGQNQGNAGFGGFNMGNVLNQALKKEAEEIKRHYESSPNDLQFILHQNPEFAQAVLNEDINVLIEYIRKHKEKKKQEEIARLERIRKLEEDPFNPENQRLIEEEIRMKNVNENLEFAQEYTPEVFGTVTMLYIDAKINGHSIQAFVDSGAQSTIMSYKSAERVGLLHLLDKRYAGIAMGVGTSRILGRIHSAKMQIGSTFFQLSLTILEDDKIEFLFGLDMLKRHQCCIDLNKNQLVFHGGELAVPFLGEGEIKKHFAADANKDKKLVGSEKIPVGVDATTEKSLEKSAEFHEEDINKLMALGFQRTQVLAALRMCGGNVDMAASYLFSS